MSPDKIICSSCGADLVLKGNSGPPVYVCLRPTCNKRGLEVERGSIVSL